MSVHLICFLPIKWAVGDVLSTWYIQSAFSGFRMKFNPRSLLYVFLRIGWHLWLWYVRCTLLGLLLTQVHCHAVVWKSIGLAVKEVPAFWSNNWHGCTYKFLSWMSIICFSASFDFSFWSVETVSLDRSTTYIVLKVQWSYGKERYQWIHQRRLQE